MANILLCYNTELRMLYDKYWWVLPDAAGLLRETSKGPCGHSGNCWRGQSSWQPKAHVRIGLGTVYKRCHHNGTKCCATCLPCSKRPSHQLPSKLPRLSFSVLAAQVSWMPLTLVCCNKSMLSPLRTRLLYSSKRPFALSASAAQAIIHPCPLPATHRLLSLQVWEMLNDCRLLSPQLTLCAVDDILATSRLLPERVRQFRKQVRGGTESHAVLSMAV